MCECIMCVSANRKTTYTCHCGRRQVRGIHGGEFPPTWGIVNLEGVLEEVFDQNGSSQFHTPWKCRRRAWVLMEPQTSV